jgi:hypothetical protein
MEGDKADDIEAKPGMARGASGRDWAGRPLKASLKHRMNADPGAALVKIGPLFRTMR